MAILGRPHRPDQLTLAGVFDTPPAALKAHGALAVGKTVRSTLSAVLKESGGGRAMVAVRMSELLGTRVTKHQLDAWTAESRDAWRFPFEYAAAFEAAAGTYALSELLAGLRGCTVLIGDEALLAEMGRLERIESEVKARRRALKARMEKRA